MNKEVLVIAGMLLLLSVQIAFADDDVRKRHGVHFHGPLHGAHAENKQAEPSSVQQGTFLIKKNIDGFNISFQVIKVEPAMRQGGTHRLLVKVVRNRVALSGLTINSKVSHPNDQSESKIMLETGGWYVASYNLGHAGDHQLMVLFKTEDGAKHFGGVLYQDKRSTAR
ncbi:MAG: hypothetical protein Q9M17_07365 [Mariprofundus sp.]|nr:hypothetical protein [Mariprofundus sp.]